MKIPVKTPASKRKHPQEPEGGIDSKNVAKVAKLENNEQTTLEHIRGKLLLERKVMPSTGQAKSNISMLASLTSRISPSKSNTQEGDEKDDVRETKETQESVSKKLDTLNSLMAQMISIQKDQGSRQNDLENGIKKVSTDVSNVADRVKVLEEKVLKGQTS